MNQKKLILIGGLAVLITSIMFGMAAFRNKSPQKSIKIGKAETPFSKKTLTEKYEEKQVFGMEEDESSHASMTSMKLTKSGISLVEKKIVKPLNRKFKQKISRSKFSRCPSGIQFYQADLDTDELMVKVINYDGCAPVDLCLLRLSNDQSLVEVWDHEKEIYISPEAWIASVKVEDFSFRPEFEEERYQENKAATSKKKTL